MKKIIPILLIGALAFGGCKKQEKTEMQPPPPGEDAQPGQIVMSSSGLQWQDLVIGNGNEAKAGNNVKVHYTGWLQDGTKFDSSVDRGQPFEFKLGAGKVIRGWDEGVEGMKVGGKRKLMIPPELAYGERGAGGKIPPNAILTFEVELLEVK